VTASNITLIVGGGHAGGRAAGALRAAGRKDPIMIIGAEPYVPYERPPLSKGILSGTATQDTLAIHPRSFYDENEIKLRLDTRVKRISPETNSVQLDDGATIVYKQLLLCTGAQPRQLSIPGADNNLVLYLRSRDDASSLRLRLTNECRLAVIGGGLIGLEVAATARLLGCDVKVFEADDILLGRLQVPTLSELVRSLHDKHGVKVVTQSTIAFFENSKSGISAHFNDGSSSSFDLILAGIGAVPEIELAEQAGIQCADGIIVNEYCETSVPGIFAAGDATCRIDSVTGLSERLETWQNAEEQAAAAAASMTGQRVPYRPVPYIWTDQFDTHIQFTGCAVDADRTVTRGEQDHDNFVQLFLKDEKVVAVLAINSPRDFGISRRLIGANSTEFDWTEFANIHSNIKSIIKAYLYN
jgi:3-phenylpropionate/trans-cinnamate dioxygenase ferredoxin reductase subunit